MLTAITNHMQDHFAAYLFCTIIMIIGPFYLFIYKKTKGLSVNFHFTRDCNYNCGFCFHTRKTKDNLSFEDIQIGLQRLKDAGMSKINFSGGEPFLKEKLLGQMVQFCKQDLDVAVSIISNGSLITKKWIDK